MAIRIVAQKDGQFFYDKVHLSLAVAKRIGERFIAEGKADYVTARGDGTSHFGLSTISANHGWTASASD